MDPFLSRIPLNFVTLTGFFFVSIFTIICFAIAYKSGEEIWKRKFAPSKEKRHESNPQYNGIERRVETRKLEDAIVELVDVIKQDKKEFSDFLRAWRLSNEEVKEGIGEIKRKQDVNWRRAFEEETEHFREEVKAIKLMLAELKQ